MQTAVEIIDEDDKVAHPLVSGLETANGAWRLKGFLKRDQRAIEDFRSNPTRIMQLDQSRHPACRRFL